MKDFIPAAKRRVVYSVFAFLGLALGAVQVGYSAAELGQPVWLTVSLSVFAFISAGIGYTATVNTPQDDLEQV